MEPARHQGGHAEDGELTLPDLGAGGVLLPVIGVVGMLGLAGVMAVLAGVIGGAPTAVLALLAGTGVGWSFNRVADNLAIDYSHDAEAHIVRQLRSAKRLAIYDPATALYHRWYFELRLAEEVHRCRRYGLSMAVLYFRLGKLPSDPTMGLEAPTEHHLAHLTSHVVRSVDLLAAMGKGEYAVCLPHSDVAGAEATVARLEKELREYEAVIGAAIFPGDANDARSLIAVAHERTLEEPLRQAA